MRRHIHAAIAAITLCALPLKAQNPPARPADPGVKTLLIIDSARVTDANVAPDTKWIVFSRLDGEGGTSSVWMAAMANPRPFRLTSDGYRDRWPTVSPTGDRVFFLSNRSTRDARGAAMYVMSIPIDKATGRPNGRVRQVTTDSVSFLSPSAISPDGAWLTYSVAGPPPALRLVPTTGGNARTLATKFSYGGGYTTFTADGKKVVFMDSGTTMLREVAATGGAVTTLTRSADRATAPAAHRDDRYVASQFAATQMVSELRDMSGQILGVARFPVEYSPSFVLRSDGRGWIGLRIEAARAIRRITLGTGVVEDVVAPHRGWPFGVTADGAIVSSSTVDGRAVVSTISRNRAPQPDLTLGAEIKSIVGLLPGGTRFLAWGHESPHTPVRNSYGVAARTPAPAYLVDRATGATRKIADSVEKSCCPRNWGAYEDAVGIAEFRGSTIDIKSIDEMGATHLIRSFPLAIFRRLDDVSIHGPWLAYADSIGKDETGVFVSIAATAAPVRIGVLARSSGDLVMGWSPDGRKLAVAYSDAKTNDRSTVRVFDVGAGPSPNASSVALDLGGTVYYYEALKWLPDGNAVLVMRGDSQANHLVLRPVDQSQRARNLGPMGSFMIEAGGRSILYTVGGPGRTSVWTAEFLPDKKQ